MTLTDVAIKSLKPASKAKKYADGEGLFLYVSTTSSKSWRFRYRNIAGIEKELTFGLYPSVSLQEARKRRFEAKKLLAEGKDPIVQKREIKRATILKLNNTFESLAREWHELNSGKWSDKHANTIMFRLKRYAIPHLGNRVISEITVLDVLDILRRIERENKFELCHRTLQYLADIFRLAVLTQKATYNPCVDLKGVLRTRKVVHRPTIKIHELSSFLTRLEASDAAQLDKLAMRLLVLTFVRPGELRKSKWGYIDFEKRLWIIPAELMKMRKEHIVPLSTHGHRE